jgi:acyl carrier protein
VTAVKQDSINESELTRVIEEEFDIEIPDEAVEAITTVKQPVRSASKPFTPNWLAG